MKKTFFMAIITWFILCGSALADINFTISPPFLNLDHNSAYIWRINAASYSNSGSTLDGFINNSDYQITSASLSFVGLNNSTEPDPSDYLYLRLLDQYYNNSGEKVNITRTGLRTYNDSSVSGDYNAPLGGVELGTFSDGNVKVNGSWLTDISYAFDSTALSNLSAYIKNNGYFGIGFDPDCHYSYSGITLNIAVGNSPPNATVPEPATMLLFGSGLVVFAGIARKRIPKL